MSDRAKINEVLKQVSQWSDEERAELMLELSNGLRRLSEKPTIDDLVGMARGTRPPPSDEEVEQWIHEYRMRKYG